MWEERSETTKQFSISFWGGGGGGEEVGGGLDFVYTEVRMNNAPRFESQLEDEQKERRSAKWREAYWGEIDSNPHES